MARSKKQKVLDYDGEDIISNLHDNILSHILSSLPTKEAARTSLLSKRWRYLWTCITSLDFHDESHYKYHAPISEKQKFLQLVYRLMQQPFSTSSILSFTLCLSDPTVCYPSDPSEYVNAFICRVLKQKVQKLCIKCLSHESTALPCAVFNCKSLIELDIDVCMILGFPSSNCLTNLQVLRFRGIVFFQDYLSSSKELTLSFPVLKVFEIVRCKFLDVNDVIIDTPMLESLAIRCVHFVEKLGRMMSRVVGTIKLFALRLRKFSYYDDLVGDIILSNPFTVIDAFFNVHFLGPIQDGEKYKNGVKACMRLKEFHESVKFLELGPNMIKSVAYLEDDLLLRLPIFERLVSLVLAWLKVEPCYDIFLKLLQNSPNLERLELISDKSKFNITHVNSKDVPSCIQCNLKVVIIRLFEWDENKLQFAKYVLKNAQVLDQLTISLVINKVNAGVRKVIKGELLSVPKASSFTQIKVERIALKKLQECSLKFSRH